MLVDLKASRVMPPPGLQIYFRPRAILTVDPVTTEVDRFMPFSRGTLVLIGVKIESGQVRRYCPSVRLSPKFKNAIFSKTKQIIKSYSVYWRPIGSRTWAFQRTHYWIPKVQDGWDPLSWNTTLRHFFLPRVVRFWIEFRRLVQNDMSTAVWSKSKPDV